VRGCLTVIVLGAAFLTGLLWFTGPPLASGVVTIGLQGSGLVADRLDVGVSADPPFELAVGHADRVTIQATNARWHGVRLATLDVTLDGVDLLGRTAARAGGRLGGVQLGTDSGGVILADVELRGAANAAVTTVHVAAANVEALALDAFEARLGVRPSSALLVVPNTIRLTLGGLAVDSKLSISRGGAIVASASGGSIVLFTPSPSLALKLTSLAVASTELVLRGTLDVGALLH
jgi:hypothetical protein